MAEEPKEKLINVREAAKECGRNMETVRRWIWAGKLPAEKLGNQLFIKREDLVNYCRETAVKYDAGVSAEVTNKLRRLKAQFRTRTDEELAKELESETHLKREEQVKSLEKSLGEGETQMKTGSRTDLIKRMRKLREDIRARTGKVFDVETMIRELREERDRELR